MKIVIAGGTGFVGSELAKRLSQAHEVFVLSRDPAKVRHGRGLAWRPPAGGEWQKEVADADAVINLAGENIGAKRWSAERKERLRSSRLSATTALVEAMRDKVKKRVLISASAVGFYGRRQDEILDETSPGSTDFLGKLASDWEQAALAASDSARVVIARLGVVLSPEGGALEKMLLPFRLFVGGPVGSGRQWMSWVDRHDVLRFFEWALENEAVSGIYNLTAPVPATNVSFAKELGRALRRPAVMPAPAFALRLVLGEMADELLLGGQRVIPRRAMEAGFTFERPTLRESFSTMFDAGHAG